MFGSSENATLTKPEWAFRNLSRAHYRAHDAIFDKMGLREVGQPLVLDILLRRFETGQRTVQGELSEIMNISPSTVTISVKSLERHGYIRKIPDETDMRRNFLEITEKGAKTARECARCFEEIDKAMYSDFSDSERALAVSMLERMDANLRAFVAECCKG